MVFVTDISRHLNLRYWYWKQKSWIVASLIHTFTHVSHSETLMLRRETFLPDALAHLSDQKRHFQMYFFNLLKT